MLFFYHRIICNVIKNISLHHFYFPSKNMMEGSKQILKQINQIRKLTKIEYQNCN